MDEFYRAVRSFPAWLAEPLRQIPQQVAETIHELRLRSGCEISVVRQGVQQPISALEECPPKLRDVTLTRSQLEDVFYALCNGSVHTHQAELAQGYLTTPLGCRVGLAGRFVRREDGETVLQTVTSLNFRISRCADVLLPEALCTVLQTHFGGMLIVGEPDSGKTTVLRKIALVLAQWGRVAAVVDERSEIFPPEIPSAPALECLSGLPKVRAMQMALRTLSPQVILLDELGGVEEAIALEQGAFSGVDFIASIHAGSASEALRRPQVRRLKQNGLLHTLVILKGRCEPGQIKEVCRI